MEHCTKPSATDKVATPWLDHRSCCSSQYTHVTPSVALACVIGIVKLIDAFSVPLMLRSHMLSLMLMGCVAKTFPEARVEALKTSEISSPGCASLTLITAYSGRAWDVNRAVGTTTSESPTDTWIEPAAVSFGPARSKLV